MCFARIEMCVHQSKSIRSIPHHFLLLLYKVDSQHTGTNIIPSLKEKCVYIVFASTRLLKDANQETAAEGELVENLQKLRKATHYRNDLLRRAYRNQQPNAIYVNTPQSLDFLAKNKEAIPQHEMDISTNEHVGTSCSCRKRERSYRPIF